MSDQAGADPIVAPTTPVQAPAPSHGARVPAVYMIKPPIVGLTVAALCFGIPALGMALVPVVGVIIGTFLGVIAIVCGHWGVRKIDYSPEPLSGRGMATTGLITGYLAIVVGLAQVAVVVLASTALTNA